MMMVPGRCFACQLDGHRRRRLPLNLKTNKAQFSEDRELTNMQSERRPDDDDGDQVVRVAILNMNVYLFLTICFR